MHHWLYLAAAIVFEVAGTTSMKLAQGFTRPLPSVLIFVFYALAFVALTLTLKKMDISVAYSVWSGVGTALIAAIGFFWFQEPLTP
ncbi:MAG: DMT family transporter, partial [Gammaproteobacteria bacterium]